MTCEVKLKLYDRSSDTLILELSQHDDQDIRFTVKIDLSGIKFSIFLEDDHKQMAIKAFRLMAQFLEDN